MSEPGSPLAVRFRTRGGGDDSGPSGSSRFTPPSGRPLGRTLLTLVAACLLICAVLVGVGWLITHPLKSTMAHENQVNAWFADQRTPDLTKAADVGTLIGQTLTGAIALVVVGVLAHVTLGEPAVFRQAHALGASQARSKHQQRREHKEKHHYYHR